MLRNKPLHILENKLLHISYGPFHLLDGVDCRFRCVQDLTNFLILQTDGVFFFFDPPKRNEWHVAIGINWIQ